MNQDFSHTLSLLRKEKGISQRVAAEDLGISQALLSHYENGIREPGLAFVSKVCDYYHVSADYLLGRTLDRDGIMGQGNPAPKSGRSGDRRQAAELRKPIVSVIVLLFDLLDQLNNPAVLQAAAKYLSTCVYLLFRQLCQADPLRQSDLFPAAVSPVETGVGDAELQLCRCQYALALQNHALQRRPIPSVSGDRIGRDYPWAYPALLDLLQDTGRRIAGRMPETATGRRRRGAQV